MNNKKVCFIICANDELYFSECVKYIQWLYVPEGMEIEILEIREAASMTAGYNEGMRSSDAKYKVYLHSDTYIKNRYFIEDVIKIFNHDTQIGMIGLVGSEKLPANGLMWSGERVMRSAETVPWEEYRYDIKDGYWDVACVDGLLMVTQYDVEWREDLFKGWDFYDVSQCFEMRRQGWRVVVPVQKNDWFIHDDKMVLQLWNYNKSREIFLKEYGEDIKGHNHGLPRLEFPESFLKGENREGFFVEEEMKRVWAAQMEVFVDIDRICRENDIKYYADFGTLLGSVRHKGYIPWDDDFDICMLREDYEKFHRVAPQVLSGSNNLLSCYRDDGWTLPFMRVINGDCITIREERLKRFHGCPYVVGVDIFPLDYLPTNPDEMNVLMELFEKMYAIRVAMYSEDKEYEQDALRVAAELEEILNVKFDREQKLLPQVLRMIDKVSSLYHKEESEKVGVTCLMSTRNDKPRSKHWYEKSIMLPFENIEVPVPAEYDEVLKSIYGDYMKPVKNSAGHNYPYFKKQREALHEMLRNNRVSVPAEITWEG